MKLKSLPLIIASVLGIASGVSRRHHPINTHNFIQTRGRSSHVGHRHHHRDFVQLNTNTHIKKDFVADSERIPVLERFLDSERREDPGSDHDDEKNKGIRRIASKVIEKNLPHGSGTPDIEFANSYDHEGYSKGML